MKLRTQLLTPILAIAATLAIVGSARANDDLALMQSYIDLMQGYYRIIEAGHTISADAEKSAILHMQKIKEAMEERGQLASAVPVFREVLKESENQAIRSAAYTLLAETLKETGRSEEATRVLIEGLKESVANANP